jgi:hypothetical protein
MPWNALDPGRKAIRELVLSGLDQSFGACTFSAAPESSPLCSLAPEAGHLGETRYPRRMDQRSKRQAYWLPSRASRWISIQLVWSVVGASVASAAYPSSGNDYLEGPRF